MQMRTTAVMLVRLHVQRGVVRETIAAHDAVHVHSDNAIGEGVAIHAVLAGQKESVAHVYVAADQNLCAALQ